MKYYGLFLFLIYTFCGQESLSMKSFVKHNDQFKLIITTKSESYSNGLISLKDSARSYYEFLNQDIKHEPYAYSIKLKKDPLFKSRSNQLNLPEFSNLIIMMNPNGSLKNVQGLDVLETELKKFIDDMISERHLFNNDKAIYLKYVLSNPSLLKSIYLKNPMVYFSAFKPKLFFDINSEKEVKLTNPVGTIPLNGIQKKSLKKDGKSKIYLVTQLVNNQDITTMIDDRFKQKNSYQNYILYYLIETEYHFEKDQTQPHRIRSTKTVKLNSEKKVDILDIVYTSKL